MSFTPVFQHGRRLDPRRQISLPYGGSGEVRGKADEYAAILWAARRSNRCPECGEDITYVSCPRTGFCSEKCYYRFRDRRRYAGDPEAARARARAYYAANRETVLEKAAAKRGRPRPAERTTCEECRESLEGQQRVVCSRRCQDARYRRLHPEAYAENERRKVARRREARRKARGA